MHEPSSSEGQSIRKETDFKTKDVSEDVPPKETIVQKIVSTDDTKKTTEEKP
jgi:hypothetical protein